MTHEQIAQHISSAREAVARMLKGFSEDGLVELRNAARRGKDTTPAVPEKETKTA